MATLKSRLGVPCEQHRHLYKRHTLQICYPISSNGNRGATVMNYDPRWIELVLYEAVLAWTSVGSSVVRARGAHAVNFI